MNWLLWPKFAPTKVWGLNDITILISLFCQVYAHLIWVLPLMYVVDYVLEPFQLFSTLILMFLAVFGAAVIPFLRFWKFANEDINDMQTSESDQIIAQGENNRDLIGTKVRVIPTDASYYEGSNYTKEDLDWIANLLKKL